MILDVWVVRELDASKVQEFWNKCLRSVDRLVHAADHVQNVLLGFVVFIKDMMEQDLIRTSVLLAFSDLKRVGTLLIRCPESGLRFRQKTVELFSM